MRRYTTACGYKRMKERMEQTRAAYFEVCDSNEDAAGAGDSSVWHDNFAYEENQRQMIQLSKKVREIEAVLDSLTILPPVTCVPKEVKIGTVVHILNHSSSQEATYLIAGFQDGDPNRNRISYSSPFGRALLGLQIDDEVHISFGGKVHHIEILEIHPTPVRNGQGGAK
jgi:transcription elongation factor GreA